MILIKFVLTGLLNTLFYYSIYALFLFFSFNYIIAVVLATAVGMLFSFKTFGKFVFQKNDNGLLSKFLLVTLINTFLNIVIIFLLKEYNLDDYTAGAIATFIVAINSFTLNKFFVFK